MAFDHHLALTLCLMIVTFCCKCIFQCLLSTLMIMVGWRYITAVATCVRSQKMVVSSAPLELPSSRKPLFANFIMYLILGRTWLIFPFIQRIIFTYVHILLFTFSFAITYCDMFFRFCYSSMCGAIFLFWHFSPALQIL